MADSTDCSSVTFIIEGKELKCDKNVLMENSEYFKTMFTGNFRENNQAKIELKEVEYKTMETIEKCIWEIEYIEQLDVDLLIKVFSICNMFLFTNLKDAIVSQLLKQLSVDTCIPIWVAAECHHEDELRKHAKLLSVFEYNELKNTDNMLFMDLKLLCDYLGNIHLHCDNEMDVFDTAMHWYNLTYADNERTEEHIYKLLHCLDFNSLTDEDISTISSHSIIYQFCDIINVLNCVKCEKKSEDISSFNDLSQKLAKSLLKSKGRDFDGVPCIVAEKEPQTTVTGYYDNYFRHRRCIYVENQSYSFLSSGSNLSTAYLGDDQFFPDVSVLYPNFLEPDTNVMKKLVDIEPNFNNVQGFCVTSFKQYILVFGGEEVIGKGPWRDKGWKYDIVTGKSSSFIFPYRRRHFQTCTVDKYIFVIGGFGRYRVYESNMFYYDIKKDYWSNCIPLPTENRFIRACCYRKKLFIFDVDGRCGFIFNPEKETLWERYSMRKQPANTGTYRSRPLFCHKDRILSYNDGDDLFELKLEGNEIIMEHLVKSKAYYYREKTSVVCKDTLYSLVDNGEGTKYQMPDKISLIKYDIEEKQSSTVFEYDEGAVFTTANQPCREYFRIRKRLHLFKFIVYDRIDQLVNNFSRELFAS